MKKTITILALFITSLFYSQSQSITGKWKTIDDETGDAKSIIEIYEKSGKIYGKVIEILDKNHKKDLCQNCEGEDANKPILGLTVVKGLSKDGEEYNSGKILDPKNGKVYKCLMVLENTNKLKVRGYIGFSLLGRTQYWHRVK
ncbi:DUF2147 domain-containing protein [Flavobacterium muglaense]|uniref:DUF2147 domain-containing protein n=1 Tax=Flavobacterium muglaense TaxID=2764716 RepID=A0A923N1Q0_9FLAO|nr:DUF2147 domain-containing protein [Flavobacterium muglaense]MBC5839240.1 DUF2147 domain-containing protein [Flavobacterium muglaense]MBC5845736.1 DUF2147 domain-containing protein [Flavobacterium muglaense]